MTRQGAETREACRVIMANLERVQETLTNKWYFADDDKVPKEHRGKPVLPRSLVLHAVGGVGGANGHLKSAIRQVCNATPKQWNRFWQVKNGKTQLEFYGDLPQRLLDVKQKPTRALFGPAERAVFWAIVEAAERCGIITFAELQGCVGGMPSYDDEKEQRTQIVVGVAAYYTMRNVYTIHARQLIAPKTLDEVRTYEGPSLTKFVFDPLDAERDVSILFSTIMQELGFDVVKIEAVFKKMLELKRVPQKMSEDELENDTCLVLVNGWVRLCMLDRGPQNMELMMDKLHTAIEERNGTTQKRRAASGHGQGFSASEDAALFAMIAVNLAGGLQRTVSQVESQYKGRALEWAYKLMKEELPLSPPFTEARLASLGFVRDGASASGWSMGADSAARRAAILAARAEVAQEDDAADNDPYGDETLKF